MFEILWELPKRDTEMWNEHTLLENDVNRLASWKVATNLQFVKNTVPVKFNKISNA